MGRKIGVKFEKSDWLPINVVDVRREDAFQISFFCTRCKKEIGRVDELAVMEGVVPNLTHKCKEEKDED
jgi:hypothetical protein